MTAASILFLCPYKAEARLLLQLFGNYKQIDRNRWGCGTRQILTWNASGPAALQTVINHCGDLHRYTHIVLFGAAGALKTELAIGQLMTADTVILDQEKLPVKPVAGFAATSIVTAPHPVISAEERQSLFTFSGAAIVDMESYYFVKICGNARIPCSIIRFVSDTAAIPFKLPFAPEIFQNLQNSKKHFSF